MSLGHWLRTVKRLFLDTAPVIYYVEEHPQYIALVDKVFERVDKGLIKAVTSAVTLAECLVIPYRASNVSLQQAFLDTLTRSRHTSFAVIDRQTGERAAQLRARYNLRLADAFQFAVALNSGCDTFLTNDNDLKRVTELKVVVLKELLES